MPGYKLFAAGHKNGIDSAAVGRFPTAFRKKHSITRIRGVHSLTECTRECDRLVSCQGLFAYDRSGFNELHRCFLLSDLGEGTASTSTVSFSLAKQSLQRFALEFQSTGEAVKTSRRFSTAFYGSHLLTKFDDATPEACARACVADNRCVAFVLVTKPSTVICRTLDNAGKAKGVRTRTVSESFLLAP